MGRGRSQFIGVAGVYYLGYSLSVRGLHAALTMGNAPDVDVLVAAAGGGETLSLQVKTARWAHHAKWYGREVRAWHVSADAPGKSNPRLWYAFVDLQEEAAKKWTPRAFLVPSFWVASYVRPEWSPKMFSLPRALWLQTEERWDRIIGALNGEAEVATWASKVPDALWSLAESGPPPDSSAAEPTEPGTP
jgi:hypothetical protein